MLKTCTHYPSLKFKFIFVAGVAHCTPLPSMAMPMDRPRNVCQSSSMSTCIIQCIEKSEAQIVPASSSSSIQGANC